MGRSWYVLYSGLTPYTKGIRLNLGIVDRLAKVAHFILVKTTYLGAKLAELYMERIVCLYGVPKKIVSDRGT